MRWPVRYALVALVALVAVAALEAAAAPVAPSAERGQSAKPGPGPEASASPSFIVDGDGIAEPLGGRRGDPTRGRRIVADRRTGLCLLCHPAPIAEERFQGDLAPDLAGVAARLSEAQLRLRVVDSRQVNPASIMPAYFRADGFERVARDRRGQTILEAGQIEDVVAWLLTLR